MEEIQTLLVTVLTPALQQLLVGIVGLLMLWLGRKVGSILDTKLEREVAFNVVQAVDLIARNLGWDGKAKKEEAIRRIKEELAVRGIKVTDLQIDSLIESAVKNFKYGYGPVPALEPTENVTK